MIATSLAALAIILVGVAMRRLGLLRDEHAEGLVNVVLYAAMPALVFQILATADLRAELLLVPVAGYLIHLTMLVLSFAVARLWRMDRVTTGSFVVVTAVGNTGFFGLPLIAASGVGVSLPAAVLYDSLATGIITWTSTVAVATTFGGRGDGHPHIDWRGLVRGLTLPPTWALVIGLAWNLGGLGAPPEVIDRPTSILAAAVLPLVMLYAGIMFDLHGLGRARAVITAATIGRLFVGPVVGLAIGLLLGLSGAKLHTVVLMSAMPTAMMSLVLGARYGLRADVLAGAVMVTTVLCTLTLPLVRWLVL